MSPPLRRLWPLALVLGAAGLVIARFSGLTRFEILIAVGVVFGLVSAGLYVLVPGGAKSRETEGLGRTFRTIFAAVRGRNYVYFVIGLGLATLGLTSLFAFAPLYLKESVGLAPSRVVWLDVAQFFGALVSVYLWGWASDRYGAKPVMLSNLTLALVLPVAWFLMPRHHAWSVEIAMAVAFAAGVANIGWTVSFSRYLFVTALPPEHKTAYVAVFYTLFGLLAGVGPLGAGALLKACGGLGAQMGVLTVDAYTPFFGAAFYRYGFADGLRMPSRRISFQDVDGYVSILSSVYGLWGQAII